MFRDIKVGFNGVCIAKRLFILFYYYIIFTLLYFIVNFYYRIFRLSFPFAFLDLAKAISSYLRFCDCVHEEGLLMAPGG